MIVHDVVQRSPEWYSVRLGRLTASRAGDMLATTKSGRSTSRKNLLMQLVLERVTGQSQEISWQSQAMKDGIEREPAAVERYQRMTGRTVTPVGFCAHDTLKAGCSPDGFVGDDGLLSIKSPIAATHWQYLKSGVIPDDYLKQITHEMWITERTWCDWFSFQPTFPAHLQTKLVRVTRVESEVLAYDKAARAFLAEVDTEFASIQTISNVAAAWRAATATRCADCGCPQHQGVCSECGHRHSYLETGRV